jgi:hypothetical protein
MKVAVQCESALLQRSLELFLEGHLSSLKQCDVVLRDRKIMDSHHSLYISEDDEADIKKPFSRSQLFVALEAFYSKLEDIESVQAYDDDMEAEKRKDFTLLEERIEHLTQEYKRNLLYVIKAFYE